MVTSDQAARAPLSRRQFLIGVGGAVGAAATGAAAFEVMRLANPGVRPSLHAHPVPAAGPVRIFHSRPDLRPPTISLSRSSTVDPGYLFLGPWASGGDQPGPLIVDKEAEPVWFEHVSSLWETNFRPYMYRGQPVLAWWDGYVRHNGYGRGAGVVVDSAYRPVARVRAANGRLIDLHEFRLTPEGTALFTCYPQVVQTDLTPVGGPSNGQVFESVFQEVDVRTGKLLLEWRSLDHIPITESYQPVSEPHDYVHLNSIEVAPDGNLLVSGRHTWTLYKLDRRTGEVIWRLGGKKSDFHLSKRAKFSWQHDARFPGDGRITLFDNGSQGPINTETESRAVVLDVDLRARNVDLAQEFHHHPQPLLASSMGSVQTLPSGNVQVGWGIEPFVSEYSPSGTQLADARLLSGFKSYRSFRLPWKGRPAHAPAASIRRSRATGKATLFVSWNGATDVSYWQVNAGGSRKDMRPAGVARRHGFETAIQLGHANGYLSVTAMDEGGAALSTSGPIRV